MWICPCTAQNLLAASHLTRNATPIMDNTIVHTKGATMERGLCFFLKTSQLCGHAATRFAVSKRALLLPPCAPLSQGLLISAAIRSCSMPHACARAMVLKVAVRKRAALLQTR